MIKSPPGLIMPKTFLRQSWKSSTVFVTTSNTSDAIITSIWVDDGKFGSIILEVKSQNSKALK